MKVAQFGRVLVDSSENEIPKAEDAAHTSADPGLPILVVRKDTAAALAGTDGDYTMLIVDASGRLHTAPLPTGTSVIGKAGHDKTGIGHGVKVVATAGTDLVLAASTTAKVVIIQAQTDNTSAIAVGASGVDATVATGSGVLLYAGDSITLEIDNLADVYIDALVSGEGVRYTYLT